MEATLCNVTNGATSPCSNLCKTHVSRSGDAIARVTYWRHHRTCHILVTPSHVSYSGDAIARVTFCLHDNTCHILITRLHVSYTGETIARVIFWRSHRTCYILGTPSHMSHSGDAFPHSLQGHYEQAVSPRPLTTKARVLSKASPCGICGRQSVSRTSYSPSTSAFHRHFHSTNSMYSFLRTIHNPSN